MKFLAFALLSFAVTTRAFFGSSSDCTDIGTATSIEFGSCKKVTVGATAKELTLDVKDSDISSGSPVLVVYNHGKSNIASSNVVVKVDTSTLIDVSAASGSGGNVYFYSKSTFSSCKVGQRKITIENTSGGDVVFGVYAMVVDAADFPAPATLTRSTNATGLIGESLAFHFEADFTTHQYFVKNYTLTLANLPYPDNTVLTLGGSSATVVGGAADFEYIPTSTLDKVASVMLSQPDMTTTVVDWTSTGPFMTPTLQIKEIFEYDTVAFGEQKQFVMQDSNPVLVRVSNNLPINAWKYTVTVETTQAYPVLEYVVNPSTVADPLTSVGSDSWEDNNAVIEMISASTNFATMELLAPAIREDYFMYLSLTRPSCVDEDYNVSITVTASHLEGECQTYVDCYADEADEHPSVRESMSANKDKLRMRHCLVTPDYDTPTKPHTRCAECLTEDDCMAGQYCHRDAGVCELNSQYYTCDRDSAYSIGLCKWKDPSDEIFGKQCRTDRGVTTAGSVRITTSDSEMLSIVAEVGKVDEYPTGARMCGGYRYYNSSSLEVFGDWSKQYVARTQLWSGVCRAGICHECAEGSNANTADGRKTCVSGKLMETIVVDDTIRTFTDNTVAGTVLSGVMMVILLQCCVGVLIWQNNRKAIAAAAAANKI